MALKSIVKSSSRYSPLAAATCLKQDQVNNKKSLEATVILTSLVDAFSILVIYLLVSLSHSGEILYLSKDTVLPEAANVATMERTTLIKIEQGKYYVEDKEVPAENLVAELLNVREELDKANERREEKELHKLMIQADKKVKYSLLNQVITASSQVGFNEVKFAVLTK